MKLRIVSDGTSAGTRVETEDGHVIDGVQAVSFTAMPGDVPEAMLVVQQVQCEIVVDPTWTHNASDPFLQPEDILAHLSTGSDNDYPD